MIRLHAGKETRAIERGKIMSSMIDIEDVTIEEVMTHKGVLQRMIVYVWDVPDFIQDKIRKARIMRAGKIGEINQPIDKYVSALLKLYDSLHQRYEDVGRDLTQTVQFAEDFNDAYLFRYEQMQAFIEREKPQVREIASNFTTRLLDSMMKLSVLNCIAESPQYSKDEDKFIVNSRHVSQAAFLIQNCYSRLTMWLGSALRVRRNQELANSKQTQNLITL